MTSTLAALEMALRDGVALCQKRLDTHGVKRALKPEEFCNNRLGRQKNEEN